MNSMDSSWGPTLLKWGLALTLLASVRIKFIATDRVVGLMNKLGLSFLANSGIVIALGVVLLIAALMLIFDFQAKMVGMFLSAFFVVSLLAGIFAGDAPFSVGPAIWKDFALLGASLYLAFSGNENQIQSGSKEEQTP